MSIGLLNTVPSILVSSLTSLHSAERRRRRNYPPPRRFEGSVVYTLVCNLPGRPIPGLERAGSKFLRVRFFENVFFRRDTMGDDPLSRFAASSIGSVVAETLTLPTDVAKTRLQLQQAGTGKPKYNGLIG
jgi:hypothetical protein